MFKTLKQNADTSRYVAAAILEDLVKETELLQAEAGSMQFSIMPRNRELTENDVATLEYVLPGYFKTN